MAYSAGLFDAIFYNSNTYASPTWVKIADVGDVEVTDDVNPIPIKVRKYGHEINLPGQSVKSITFNMVTNVGATAWDALRTKMTSKGTVDIVAYYKYTDNSGAPTTGDKGIRMQAFFTKFPLTQPLEGADESACELVPDARIMSGESVVHEPEVYTAS